MQYIDLFIERYGTAGALLAAVIIAMFVMQVCKYALYARICRYSNDKRPRRTDDDNPPVSVIAILFSENRDFLENGLMRLLAQDYDNYEVVVVYVGADADFYDDLKRLRLSFPNLRTTAIDAKPRYPISDKMALNIGIKAASNPHILLTSPYAVPRTNRWIALMARGFMRGETVLGYCAIERRKNLLNNLLRIDRMMSSAEWLSAAAAGRPWRAQRCNMGFDRRLYFDVNGFGHLSMNVGVDDLFMQKIMTAGNTSIVLSPRATVTEQWRGSYGAWLRQRRIMATTRRFYPADARRTARIEPVSRVLFFTGCLAALIAMPDEYRIAVAALVAARYIAVLTVALRIARRLGEPRIAAAYPLYDLLSPFARLAVRLSIPRKASQTPSEWRYTNI